MNTRIDKYSKISHFSHLLWLSFSLMWTAFVTKQTSGPDPLIHTSIGHPLAISYRRIGKLKHFSLLGQFAMLETFTTAIYDTFPKTRERKTLVTLLVASGCFLTGLPCVSQVCRWAGSQVTGSQVTLRWCQSGLGGY